MYHLLFKAASQTLLTIAKDPKHLGAHIGMTMVLHTWGSAMTHARRIPRSCAHLAVGLIYKVSWAWLGVGLHHG